MSAILLVVATIAALVLANSPLHDAYEHVLHLPVSLGSGAFAIDMTVHHVVNDVLMALFFFLVGMEIKRELARGELSTPSRAALPVFGALGGMILPAAIYAALHVGGPASRGWGIPMATDIAFAVAALGMFGARVSPGLRVFLLALAIVDDIGAILVIAIFYSSHLTPSWLAAAAGGLVLCALLGRANVRSYAVYFAIGAFVWYATWRSGVHATIAGVALGLLTPARPLPGADHSPIDTLEHRLHPWIAFGVLPLFALCNAGVSPDAQSLGDPLGRRVALGVALGLLVGKPVGVTLVAWLAVKLRIAELPQGVTWSQVFGAGLLAGIGFTVALFVSALAFEEGPLLSSAKIGTLGASLLAAILGSCWLWANLPARQRHTPDR